jgi:hypothetical protein
VVGYAIGLDFGTTNSLVTVIQGGRAVPLLDERTTRPHPSVVWYRGDDVIVGAEARAHLDRTDGTAVGFVRSPKMSLRRGNPMHVEGRQIDPVDAVAEVLRYIRSDARKRHGGGYAIDRAVFTIPVDFGGVQRRALRSAARKAGISVVQFVHEPAAALYGYLRSQPDPARLLAEYEGRMMLVFDWGGGTLDLTLCKLVGGTLLQVASAGNNDNGGDVFDERLRNLVRRRHAEAHKLDDVLTQETPGMGAKLLAQCELAKIELSDPETDEKIVYVRDYLRSGGVAGSIRVTLNKADINHESASLVRDGLRMIDRMLEENGLERTDIALCLPTGGMVNLPAIRNGLLERFGALAPKLRNGDRIISEGAAWIAHDGLRLTLAKPIEIRVADGSGSGHYLEIVSQGHKLPAESESVSLANRQFVCADPRNGVAVFEFVKPKAVGPVAADAPRETLGLIKLEVDPNARPLLERLGCEVQIDENYVAKALVRSEGCEAEAEGEFHRLEFGLEIGRAIGNTGKEVTPDGHRRPGERGSAKIEASPGQVAFRPNIAPLEAGRSDRTVVAGDLAYENWPDMFDRRSLDCSEHQLTERNYYQRCGTCRRTLFEIETRGPCPTCNPTCYPKGWSRSARSTGAK